MIKQEGEKLELRFLMQPEFVPLSLAQIYYSYLFFNDVFLDYFFFQRPLAGHMIDDVC